MKYVLLLIFMWLIFMLVPDTGPKGGTYEPQYEELDRPCSYHFDNC